MRAPGLATPEGVVSLLRGGPRPWGGAGSLTCDAPGPTSGGTAVRGCQRLARSAPALLSIWASFSVSSL